MGGEILLSMLYDLEPGKVVISNSFLPALLNTSFLVTIPEPGSTPASHLVFIAHLKVTSCMLSPWYVLFRYNLALPPARRSFKKLKEDG